jgi:hypothetical protein
MIRGKQERERHSRRANRGRGSRTGSLVAHAAFAPLLGFWGAALGGLVMLVLPPAMIAGLTASLPGAVPGLPVQPLLAALTALVLGGALFILAAAMTRGARRRAERPSIAQMVTRRVRPIDPVRDLGTRSLDEPIEPEALAVPGWREDEDAETQAEPAPPAADNEAGPPPRALDLATFAAMPGRNAVWVEEAPATPQQEPVPDPDPAPAPAPGTAALARLRAVPPGDLSLAQMVERFAGALQEHRAGVPARALSVADLAGREAALAEALKALAKLGGDSAISVPQRQNERQTDPMQARRGVG